MEARNLDEPVGGHRYLSPHHALTCGVGLSSTARELCIAAPSLSFPGPLLLPLGPGTPRPPQPGVQNDLWREFMPVYSGCQVQNSTSCIIRATSGLCRNHAGKQHLSPENGQKSMWKTRPATALAVRVLLPQG